MVGGTPKPFACKHEGCDMTFTNEDHLNVHQKKHEMDLNLNLGNKTNIFVADQTPTPTRFLRNCEEVGLFQDLQNVNPFEETFRRAVELVKTGSLPEPDLPTDDTLHTPHVFPLLPEENGIFSGQNIGGSSENQSSPCNNTLTSHVEINKIENQTIFGSSNLLKTTGSDEKIDGLEIQSVSDHNYILDNNKSIVESSEIINFKCKHINLRTENTSLPTKLKLKQVLLQNRKQSIAVANIAKSVSQTMYLTPINIQNEKISIVPQTTLSNDKHLPILTPATIKLPIVSTLGTINLNDFTQNQTVKSKTVKTNNRSTRKGVVHSRIDDKREDMLERNRAAALRCREKRKHWIKDLESKYNVVCKYNQDLQKDVGNLRNEVLQLKTLLLAHKDCSVTKAMNMGQRFVIEPTQILSVQMTPNNDILNKTRPVLPKEETEDESINDQVKIRKINPTTIDVKDISFVTTQSKKSVIVLNTSYNV